jgi:hypothetical protein
MRSIGVALLDGRPVYVAYRLWRLIFRSAASFVAPGYAGHLAAVRGLDRMPDANACCRKQCFVANRCGCLQ